MGRTPSGRRTVKVLNELYLDDLEQKYACHGSPCPECQTYVRPVLITPTHLKDYRNPHIARIWYETARALRQAQRVIFVGYGMPEDDVDVIYLFKRGLGHLDASDITVVERAASARGARLDAHPVGQRYRALFGDELDWQTGGFETWIAEAQSHGFAPTADASGTRRQRTPRTTARRRKVAAG